MTTGPCFIILRQKPWIFSAKTQKTVPEGIGWCLLNSDQKVLLLFVDGTALILDYASGRLAYSVGKQFE